MTKSEPFLQCEVSLSPSGGTLLPQTIKCAQPRVYGRVLMITICIITLLNVHHSATGKRVALYSLLTMANDE